jgi:hypothetical protein
VFGFTNIQDFSPETILPFRRFESGQGASYVPDDRVALVNREERKLIQSLGFREIISDPNDKVISCLLVDKRGSPVSRGIAIRNKIDDSNRVRGLMLARARALRAAKKGISTEPIKCKALSNLQPWFPFKSQNQPSSLTDTELGVLNKINLK